MQNLLKRALLASVFLACALPAMAQPVVDDTASNSAGTYRQTIPTEQLNPGCPNAMGTGVAGAGVVGKTYGGTVCPAPGVTAPAAAPDYSSAAGSPNTSHAQTVQGCPTCTAQPVNDPNNAAYLGERALTVGTADSVGVGRSFKANCTAGGSVTVTYGDGSTGSFTVAVGTNIFGAAITTINATPTATCTYSNLK